METFQANAFSGAGAYEIPLTIPSARGSQPQLVLSYSSGRGNGVFGLGFAVGLPSVSRKTDTGIPTYTGSDVFVMAGEGELVQKLIDRQGKLVPEHRTATEDGVAYDVFSYLPRKEGGFSSIEHWIATETGVSCWKLVTRDNVASTFGATAASQIVDPHNPTHIFEWLIDRTVDGVGNAIVYRYRAENGEGVSRSVSEIDRDIFSSKYIHSIQYGNYYPDPLNNDQRYAFEIVFDYGEYALDNLTKPGSDPYEPVGTWSERLDAFSSYRSGFEIRTLRLCRNILVFHHFDELGALPCLTKAIRLGYEESRVFSLVTAVTQTGYRINADGSYEIQSLPPLEFAYSTFAPPSAPRFTPLKVDGKADLPGFLSKADLLPIDLYGEGLAGLLFSDATTTHYYEPLGNGAYQAARVPDRFPNFHDLGNAALSLQSLDANGLIELVAHEGMRAGFFAQDEGGGWRPYRSFESIPTPLDSSARESVDLTGDGRADLAVVNASSQLCLYRSEGKRGYSAGNDVSLPRDFPYAASYGEPTLVTFADMFGDGLMHRVRISSGSVEVWPSLGYGRFGKRVFFANAPVFSPDTTVSRIVLADVNGSGAQDLAIVYPDRVEIFLNQSGNSFSATPYVIGLPESYDASDRIQFSDVLGQGTSALIFSKAGAPMRHWYYNFGGALDEERNGQRAGGPSLKPYLLTRIVSNQGRTTEIHYASSTTFYLKDKADGYQWVTRLPFPVHVVEKIVSVDEISGLRVVNAYRYHDGYYDPVERVFRGFGYVESWDSESYDEYRAACSAAGLHDLPPAQYVAPTHTKTWYDTGVYLEREALLKQYREAFFSADKAAYRFPDNVFDARIFAPPSDTARQACAALAGTTLRREVYAAGGAQDAAHPYVVTESNAEVRLLQPMADQAYAVFLVSPNEHIAYNYERNPLDPSVQQTFVLEIDPASGKTTKSCTIVLPRRSQGASSSEPYPEQFELKASATSVRYIDTADADAFRYRGVAYEEQKFQLFGLDCAGKSYFTFDDLTSVVAAIDDPSPYESSPALRTVQAMQLTWSRHYFWDADQQAALPLGEIAARGLAHHTETAVFPASFRKLALGDTLTGETLSECGGYVFDQDTGYWWNKGSIRHYFTVQADFYLPCKIETGFVEPTSALFAKTTIEYDRPYRLFPVQMRQFIDEAAGVFNAASSEIDYATVQPHRHTDINGNVSEVLFDPLGQVIVATLFGMKDGQQVGGMRLYSDQYQLQRDASRDTVLANQEKFLQGATHYFYYDLFAWKMHREPCCAIDLVRDDFYYASGQASAFSCQTSVEYRDGFGRILETRTQAEPDDAGTPSAERWVVSGKTIYNNKGMPCEQYLPFFSDTSEARSAGFEAQVPPPTVTRYDPLLRAVQIDTPKGFVSRVVFTPWEERHYDEDDTVVDSPFYIAFMASYPSDPTPRQIDEKDALDKAAKFYNTPTTSILDNAGRRIRTIQNNLGALSADSFADIVRDTPITPDELFNELITQGYLIDRTSAPVGMWVSDTFQPYRAGFVLNLDEPYRQFAERVVALLKQNCLTTFYACDAEGRVTESIDPRLYYGNQTNGRNDYNFKYRYAMGASKPLLIDSTDAGLERHLDNIFGARFWSLSPRNYCQLISYDRLQRCTTVLVKQVEADQPVTSYADFSLVEAIVYGETQAQSQNDNLRGQPYQENDLAGIAVKSAYDLLGKCIEVTRQIAVEYQAPIDWRSVPPPPVDAQRYTAQSSYDARGRRLTEIAPDGSVTTCAYNVRGLLDAVRLRSPDNTDTQIVARIDYDASSKRTTIRYGNAIATRYTYEWTSQRLTNLLGTRPRAGGGGVETVQDVDYTYDPVGNVTRSRNRTFETVFRGNQRVDPLADYTYDALYRLLEANGRQHPGINADTFRNNVSDGDFKQSIFSQLPNLNDDVRLENYSEIYTYDAAGNLLAKQHRAASASWVKDTPVAANSNRLAGLEFDASGNQRQLDINNTVDLSFNYCERLVKAAIIKRPQELDDCDYYVYDAEGQRVRRVSERMASGGAVTLIDDKIYLGDYEIRRRIAIDANGNRKVMLERETLRIMDDERCIAIVQHVAAGDGEGARQFRYQLADRLGSIACEYDDNANLVSYEEYFPYGGTAIVAGSNQAEVALKDYRYGGKECDDSTGLYYYGARYYCSWLGRWLNPDPGGTIDGLNLFRFALGNPTTLADGDGRSVTVRRVPGRNGNLPTVRIHVTGVLVNNSGVAYTPLQMRAFARRLERQIARSYRGAGLNVRYVGSATIRASNRIHRDDHVFRLAPGGRLPTFHQGIGPRYLPGQYRGAGVVGYAPGRALVGGLRERQRAIFIRHSVANHAPGPGGTGLTVGGGATLERTGAHELGHTFGLDHPPAAGGVGALPGNLMNQSGAPNPGLQITEAQAMQIETEFNAGRLNGGDQGIDPRVLPF